MMQYYKITRLSKLGEKFYNSGEHMTEDWMHLFVIIAGYRTECSGVMGQILFP